MTRCCNDHAEPTISDVIAMDSTELIYLCKLNQWRDMFPSSALMSK